MALSISRLVRVLINLSPLAAPRRSFGILNIVGDSDVINGLERIRSYSNIEGVALDFGTSAPEYEAALLYFAQVPKPRQLMISRWIESDSAALLIGGILTPAQQVLSNFTAVTSGGFRVTVDGVLKSLTGLNFSAAANLNAVAAIVDGALSGATVAWNGSQFVITSATTGSTSSVTFATAPVSGTDISTLLKLTSSLALPLVPGYDAETPVECVALLANKSSQWYGIMFASSNQPNDVDSLEVSDLVEAFELKRMYGVTITDSDVLSSAVTNDLASEMKAAAYKQSFCQYSSSNDFVVASMFGRAFTVDFNANKSTITLMYKQEPLVVAEDLTEQEANVLQSKRCNVFVLYVNDTMIIQYGVMSGPAWFDETHGLDWFQDAVQNSCYNLLYTSKTKIPQTDAGVNQIVNAINGVCGEAVNNGLVAPGVWNADGFGQLQMGDYLKDGYYTYAQPIALQSQSDREARVAPPIQTAIKLAGAIQEMDILIDVNR